MHGSFIAAGADVITTNSYAVVPFHIGAARFASRGEALADLAGRLARQAVADASRAAATDVARQAAVDARQPAVAGTRGPAVTDSARRIKVAGSLPPVCGSYRTDLFRPDEARPILQTLVRGLAPHVDHWQGETLSAIEEAELVREVIDATGGPARPLWLSFTLEDEATSAAKPACVQVSRWAMPWRPRSASRLRPCSLTAVSRRSWARLCPRRGRLSRTLERRSNRRVRQRFSAAVQGRLCQRRTQRDPKAI